ncbi:MAG: rubrerythrin family protein [Clostridiales bacterium]|nr:rubrerythrin family protein [Clostridiales bacterium]
MLATENKSITGTQTEKNLFTAFTGECQAHAKYLYYAEKARENGYNQIADLFEETAGNELQHAKIWFEFIKGGQVPETPDNLTDALNGEHFEWEEMYSKMAEDAKNEGFDRLAYLFDSVATIENYHETRFLKLLENVKSGTVFTKEGDTLWICGNCGHVYVGKTAPENCPVCSKPQAFFEQKSKNY